MAKARNRTKSTAVRRSKSSVAIDKVTSPGAVAIGTWPTPEKPIRVTMPAEIAFNLSKLQRTVGSVMTALGCPTCCSGYDITFQGTDFVADPKTLKVKSVR